MTHEEKHEQIIEKMAVLSEPMRIKILLEIASNKELRGKDILEKFSVTQPTMSHHLNILTSYGIIDIRKEGRCIWYSVNQETMSDIKNIVLAISENKVLRKSTPKVEPTPLIRKVSTKSKETTNNVVAKVKKSSSVPRPKQIIEVPDIEELKKNKKKKKDKNKSKDEKDSKKKKDKKKKK